MRDDLRVHDDARAGVVFAREGEYRQAAGGLVNRLTENLVVYYLALAIFEVWLWIVKFPLFQRKN